MGNWAAIFIKTNNIPDVVDRLKALSGIRSVSRGEFPTEELHRCVCGGAAGCLAVAQTQPEWVMVRHNGLRIPGWGMFLSLGEEYGEGRQVILASGSHHERSYHWSLYENGLRRREIEYSAYLQREPVNFGKRFHFEAELQEFGFDYEGIDCYAHQFGLEIVPDYEVIREWTILRAKPSYEELLKSNGRRRGVDLLVRDGLIRVGNASVFKPYPL
jgi:hypothetical protein